MAVSQESEELEGRSFQRKSNWMERATSSRKSSARNAFGKEWSKARVKCNVDLGGGIERAIDCNAHCFVVPWKVTGGGALACFPHDGVGKLPDQVPILQAHKSALSSFSLCDLDPSLLVTAAREPVIRVTDLFSFRLSVWLAHTARFLFVLCLIRCSLLWLCLSF